MYSMRLWYRILGQVRYLIVSIPVLCTLAYFAHAFKKPWVVTHPLMEYIAIDQPASVKIREMWQLGRDTVMYPPASNITGLVMTNGDPRDNFFYPTLTLMID